jgi:hypothetical protein
VLLIRYPFFGWAIPPDSAKIRTWLQSKVHDELPGDLAQIGSLEVGTTHQDVFQPGSLQAGSYEFGITQIRITQVGSTQVSPAQITSSAQYQMFKTAVRAVAGREKLPDSWVNDLIGDFLRDAGTVPEGILWRSYTLLEVYIPPGEYILALKLLANRPKDQDDITELCQRLHIHTRDQAQYLLDHYIPNKQIQYINEIDTTLEELFP